MCFYGIDSKVVFQSVPRNVSFTIHKQIVSQAVLQVLAFKAEGGRLDRIRRSLCRCVPGRRIRMLRPVLPSELIVTAAVGYAGVNVYVRLDLILLSTLQS